LAHSKRRPRASRCYRVWAMRTAIAFTLLAIGAAGCTSGAGDCVAAGGTCRIGTSCVSQITLPHDCTNGQITPAGATCCAPCPKGTVENDAVRACVGEDAGDAGAEAAVLDAGGG
jgi:hypothetical protein